MKKQADLKTTLASIILGSLVPHTFRITTHGIAHVLMSHALREAAIKKNKMQQIIRSLKDVELDKYPIITKSPSTTPSQYIYGSYKDILEATPENSLKEQIKQLKPQIQRYHGLITLNPSEKNVPGVLFHELGHHLTKDTWYHRLAGSKLYSYGVIPLITILSTMGMFRPGLNFPQRVAIGAIPLLALSPRFLSEYMASRKAYQLLKNYIPPDSETYEKQKKALRRAFSTYWAPPVAYLLGVALAGTLLNRG